jgi:hypothetical protein
MNVIFTSIREDAALAIFTLLKTSRPLTDQQKAYVFRKAILLEFDGFSNATFSAHTELSDLAGNFI